MTRNNPIQEPVQEPTGDEPSSKEQERRRRQEARREEKRQQQELRRIEKQMKEPTPKWVFISLLVIVVLLGAVAFGGYRFWCSYIANLQRESFMDNYSVADLTAIARYAPDQLRQVEELKQAATNASGALSHKQVVAKYREAEDMLATAVSEARANSDSYEAALARFGKLKKAAAKNQLERYAKRLWQRIEEAETAATDDSARDFSIALATERLNQAIRLMQEISDSYDKLKALNAAHGKYEKAAKGLRNDECRRNAADTWTSLQGLLRRAESAMEASEWDEATRDYLAAAALIKPISAKVKAARKEAQEAVVLMRQAVEGAKSSGMDKSRPGAWTRILQDVRRAEDAYTTLDYVQASKLAHEATALMGKAGKNAEQALTELMQTLTVIKKLYEKANADQAFFVRNWGKQWRAIGEANATIRVLHKAGKTTELLKAAQLLRTDLETLLREKKKVLADLDSARERLEAVEKSPMYVHIEKNYPEQSLQTADLRRTAQRRLDRGDVRKARDLLIQAADTAETALKKVGTDRTRALTLRAAIAKRRDEFQDGIRRFMGPRMTGISQTVERLEQQITAHLYRKALETAKRLGALLPKERYESQDNGTVIDFGKGVMWIADGASLAGGNGGRPLDWYAALKWVASVRTAEHDDWQLPTEEHLRDLHHIPAQQRDKLFPNTVQGVHWTRLPSQNVNEALAVDVTTGRVTREDKKKRFHVRAMRQPEVP